jgi:hypothetical protein
MTVANMQISIEAIGDSVAALSIATPFIFPLLEGLIYTLARGRALAGHSRWAVFRSRLLTQRHLFRGPEATSGKRLPVPRSGTGDANG